MLQLAEQDHNNLRRRNGSLEPSVRRNNQEGIATSQILRERLHAALSNLEDGEANVVRLRKGLTENGHHHTLDEVSRLMKSTRERVRQLEARALRKLKFAEFRAPSLRGFLG